MMLDARSHRDAVAADAAAHLPADHPPCAPARGSACSSPTSARPTATDYWSMRRYLNEFLSDRRVIDYPALEVAAAPAARGADQAAVLLGRELSQVDLELEQNESPL